MRSSSEFADIFTTQDEIYLVFAEKSKFSFYFILREIQKAQPNFSPGRSSFDLTFSVCLLGTTFVKQSLHLVNGLESYFNE